MTCESKETCKDCQKLAECGWCSSRYNNGLGTCMKGMLFLGNYNLILVNCKRQFQLLELLKMKFKYNQTLYTIVVIVCFMRVFDFI